MYCKEFKGILDSYISDELLIETNHEVLRHLENCRDCRHELADRRNLKLRIRQTIKGAAEMQLDPVFAKMIAAGLRDVALRPSFLDALTGGNGLFNSRAVAFGFASIIFVVFGVIVWLDLPNSPSKSQEAKSPQTNTNPISNSSESEIAHAVRVSWNDMTSQAVGDHKNCAVEFHLTEKPISLDEAALSHGAFNKDLDKTVVAALKKVFKGNTPDGVELLEAHSCLYDGRRFAHIVVRHKGRVVSLLITDTDLPSDNDDIQSARFDDANAAGVHVGHHAVFVVSQLPEAENALLARAIAPAIRLHAEKVGA
ncbi:MAG: zf-HC2 domain-containing protein [Pyrinomonadaceae bacterium]